MSKVELFENERAAGYQQFVNAWIPHYHDFLAMLPKLLHETEPKTLLAAGCGTGNEIEQFIQAREQWQITGIDPSPEMMQQAKVKFQNHPEMTLLEGVVSDLDSKTQYGAATLLLVLHFLEDNGDKLKLLQDIAERLLPGAPLVLLDITGNKTQIRQNLNVLRLILPEGLPEEDIRRRLHRIENELYAVSEERLAELCQEAGFEAPLRFFQSSVYMGWLTRKR